MLLVAPRRPPRDTCDAHWRQGTTNCSLSGRDQAMNTRDPHLLPELKANRTNKASQQENSEALEHDYCAPFTAKTAGNSSTSETSSGLTSFAPCGIAKVKSSDATSLPVFQSQTSTVYCGDPLILVLVMT